MFEDCAQLLNEIYKFKGCARYVFRDFKMEFILLVLGLIAFLVISSKVMKKKKNKAKDSIFSTLRQYDITVEELIFYGCKYVGGHPDRDSESNNIFFTKKNGKLVFFTGAMAHDTDLKETFSLKNMNPIDPYKNFFRTLSGSKTQQPKKLNILVEGEQIHEEIKNDFYELNHLFDIPIDAIADIRYFDATSSSIVGLVGGDYWAVPIKINKGDASVLIDWRDGKFGHSTEFRFVGFLRGMNANKRANSLRNLFIRLTK